MISKCLSTKIGSSRFLSSKNVQTRSIYTAKPTNAFPPPPAISPRRVVVTGMGLVTPLGTGVQLSWKRLIEGKSGVKPIQPRRNFNEDALKQLPVKIAASVDRKGDPGTDKMEGAFDVNEWVPRSIQGTVSPFIEFALAACTEALKDANWNPKLQSEEDQLRTGVCIASGIASLEDITTQHTLLEHGQYRKISPYFIPRMLVNLAAGQASIQFACKGPNHAASTACASAAHSIGDALKFIRYGEADVMLAGGSEACITPLAIAGFSRAKALAANFNDHPELASRPFDKEREGFVMAEGSGILVLEEYQHAMKRGARIYAEVRGCGVSGDAFHITAPSADGSGAIRAMNSALQQAGLRPENIGYINAHATSTPLGDAIEVKAIQQVFGEQANSLCVSSTKGSIGHLLGAAGSVEAIFAILAMNTGVIPPTLNLHNVDHDFQSMNFVPLTAQKRTSVDAVLSNSFGFGGTNCALVFSKI